MAAAVAAAACTTFKSMLLITIFSELTVTFAPSWMVMRTGTPDENVTQANLIMPGSDVATWAERERFIYFSNPGFVWLTKHLVVIYGFNYYFT